MLKEGGAAASVGRRAAAVAAGGRHSYGFSRFYTDSRPFLAGPPAQHSWSWTGPDTWVGENLGSARRWLPILLLWASPLLEVRVSDWDFSTDSGAALGIVFPLFCGGLFRRVRWPLRLPLNTGLEVFHTIACWLGRPRIAWGFGRKTGGPGGWLACGRSCCRRNGFSARARLGICSHRMERDRARL